MGLHLSSPSSYKGFVRSLREVILGTVLMCSLPLAASVRAGDAVYSGPQIGEKTTPFRVREVVGESQGKVFLFGDRVAGEERLKAAAGSLKLRPRVGLSLDGAEGPGNYGLNKECRSETLSPFPGMPDRCRPSPSVRRLKRSSRPAPTAPSRFGPTTTAASCAHSLITWKP